MKTGLALRLASRAVAAAWLGATLAFLGAALPAGEPVHGGTARLAALRVGGQAREVAVEAPMAAAQASRASPQPLRIGAAEIARGHAILGGGAFPVVVAGYADFPSFRDYALAMEALGARLAVVRGRRIVGGVDLARGKVHAQPLDGTFSPRARDYADEPGLAELASTARARFGAGAEVMMLVPRELDAGIFGGIAEALSRRGGDPDAYREVQARYLRGPAGGVWLQVDAAVGRDGSRQPLDLVIDLGAAAPSGGAARLRSGS